MPPRDPYTLPGHSRRMPTMHASLKQRRPRIAVTQGGSSRKNAGAKPAATRIPSRRQKRRV